MKVVMRLAVILAVSASSTTFAQDHAFVIEAGRELEVEALFDPFSLGDEISLGWRISSISIDRTAIIARLVGPAGAGCDISLRHPSDPSAGQRRTASFAISITGSEHEQGRESAVEILVERLDANDQGSFWSTAVVDREREDRMILRSCPWFLDGVLLCAVLLFSIVAISVRQLGLAAEHRMSTAGLVAICITGGWLRLLLSPNMLFGAWPHSRTTTLHWLLFYGPGIDRLSTLMGETLYESQLMTATGLCFAVVTPCIVFSHGKLLLGTTRRALIAAAIVAVLPVHIRFSHSEVAFIPSIVLSSTLLAVVHMALKDTNRRWRGFATILVAPLMVWVITARPLNFIFFFLVVGAVLYLGVGVQLHRKATILVLASVSSAIAIGLALVSEYSSNFKEGLSLAVLLNGVRLLIDLDRNTLINATITPFWLTLVATWGVVRCWKKERALLTFLLIWITLFFVTHAYVVPISVAMQARYHLHLVVPFVFVVSLGLDKLLEQKRRIANLVFALTAVAPVIHAGFITDTEFSDFYEVEFLREVRDDVAEGCTVLELVRNGSDQDARFRRLGVSILEGQHRQRFRSKNIDSLDSRAALVREVEALLHAPPQCLYFYEGLHCATAANEPRENAPDCRALHRTTTLEPVSQSRFENRVYDDNTAPGLRRISGPVTITLYRVLLKTTGAPARSRRVWARASP